MIIRSQDKKTIANIDCIDTITIIGEEIRYFSGTENSFGILGYYSTEDKAVKVLDLICETYEVFCAGNAHEQTVFNMPQDSEV